jgi:hypothetical protein
MYGKSLLEFGSCFALTTALLACAAEEPNPNDNTNGTSSPGGAAGSGSGAGGTVGGVAGAGGSNGGSGGAGAQGGASAGTGSGATGGSAGSAGTGATGGSAGTGGTGGSSGTAGSGGTAGTGGNTYRPPCLQKTTQIITIGDSYMNWVSHTFPADLNAALGVTLRPTYAIGAYAMASGGIGLIPSQFDTAVMQDKDILLVIMTGGGNDVLVPAPGRPDCKNMANAGMVAGCQQIVTDALAASETLMTKMVAAGVKDVIYFFYPHVPAPTAIGGQYPNVMLDYALPKVKAFCDGVTAKTQGKGNCWFIDLVPLFEGHPEYFAPTDIHENSTGSKVIAKAIADMMKSKCLGQPASSGCCTP